MSDHLPVAVDLAVDLSTVSSLAKNIGFSQPEAIVQNPVRGHLSIKLKNYTGNWQYQVTDLTGRRYLSGESTTSHLNTPFEVPAGMYLLVITTSEGQTVRKLLKSLLYLYKIPNS